MSPWLAAARPKTLPAAVVPVWTGSVLAWWLAGRWSPVLAACALISAVLIQVATNLFNDALDFAKGADTDRRIGPARLTAGGLASPRRVMGVAAGVLAAACVAALPLILARGWPILAIGVPALYFAFGYTGGPLPLAYRGLGELFVLVFFGWVAVPGSVFVNVGEWYWADSLVVGTQAGLLSTALIAINNLRDMTEDASSGKRTLAVRFGLAAARIEIAVLCLAPPLLGLVRWPGDPLGWFPAAGLPLGGFIAWRVAATPPSRSYNNLLALAGVHLLLFALFFTLGACF
jgi:1,4-dihydroxy-2-naphthoate octaprenyltransferase